MTAQLVCDALQMALWRRKRPDNVIVHTDRGGQYCSADYQNSLKHYSLRGSMSAKAVVRTMPARKADLDPPSPNSFCILS